MKEHGQQHPERRALNRMVRDGVGRRVDVNEKQRGGRRGPRRWLYFLSDSRGGEAVIAGARRCGVKDDADKVKRAYMRGGLKGRHTVARNDFLIRLMLDAAEEGVEVPFEECWGEAFPGYPLRGAKVVRDEAGRDLEGRDRDRAGYERILPDGRFTARWTGVEDQRPVESPFDLEVEIWTRTAAVADKVDARAAMLARLLDRREEDERAAWRREIRDIAADPRWIGDDTKKARQEALDARLAERDGPVPYFAGLGPEAVPVVFLFETSGGARSMRDRILREDVPRLRALRERLSPFGVNPDRLFAFVGYDLLLPNGPRQQGHTLDNFYLSLGRDEESLLSVARCRAGALERRGR